MIAGFDWWLLLVGIVGGAGLVWLVLADFRRHDDEVAADEGALEADWIADTINVAGRPVDGETVEEVLRLHRAYLAGPAPDLDPLENGPLPEPATSVGRDSTPVESDGSQR